MMNSPNVKVNGLPLPQALVKAIRTGRWVAPAPEKLQAVFPLEALGHPEFFNLDGMERENKGWCNEKTDFYLGRKDDDLQPGDIDPAKSVVIADLGPDRLVALDYRRSAEKPRVVYLTGNEESRWVEAAPDVESFMALLDIGLNRGSPRITHISWGRMEVEGIGTGRDFKLFPGGGREWDWAETNTHHVPGIQPADVRELLEQGSEVLVLTRGMQLVLQTCPETLQMLRDKNIRVFVEETKAAVEIYNQLVEQHELVGGLFHSTC